MKVTWLNGHGQEREADSVAEFVHDNSLYAVAFDPSFGELRVFEVGVVSLNTGGFSRPVDGVGG